MHFIRLLHAINLIVDLLPSGGRLIDFSARFYFSHAVRRLRPDVDQTAVIGVNYELDDYARSHGECDVDMCLKTEELEHR